MDLTKEIQIGGYTISTDRKKLDREYIHNCISKKTYWAQGIPRKVVDTSIDNALCLGVYQHAEQIAFARLITDYATFGYLADVFVDEAHRGRGLSKQMLEFLFGLPELSVLRRIMLGTRDAHSLYSRFGFRPLAAPNNFMEIHRPDIYKNFIIP